MENDSGVGSIDKNSCSTLESLRAGLSLFRPFTFGAAARSSSGSSVAATSIDHDHNASNNVDFDSGSLGNSLHQHKIGHRRVDETGQITYKRCPLEELRAALQLGIECSVATEQATCQRDVLLQDFSQTLMFEFPSAGSRITPAHKFKDFTFKAYAPVAFQHFRNKFGIKSSDFLVSLCKDEWRDLPNPGASGSVFYLSSNDRFIIKTVQEKEARFLLQLLPGYYMNLVQNPETLLPKFFGLYCYQRLDKNIRVIVMNNLIPSSVSIIEKYDLKGSSYKRRASEKERKKDVPTLKDLDFRDNFPSSLQLEPRLYNRLMVTLQKDLRVLTSFEIMDYSLLVGIAGRHRPSQNLIYHPEIDPSSFFRFACTLVLLNPSPIHTILLHVNVQKKNTIDSECLVSSEDGEQNPVTKAHNRIPSCTNDRLTSLNGKQCHRLISSTEYDNCENEASFSENAKTSRSLSIRRESRRTDASTHHPTRILPSLTNIAATGIECHHRDTELMVYVGIIDILQCYRLKKRLEHALKTTVLAMDEISICHPKRYATRFYRFLSRVAFQKRLGIYRLPPSYDSITLTSASHFSSYLDTINTQPTFHSEEFLSNQTSSCSSLNSSPRYNAKFVTSPWWSAPLTQFTGLSVDNDSATSSKNKKRQLSKHKKKS